MSRNDFIYQYVLSAVQGYVNGKGRIDFDAIVEDASIFFEKIAAVGGKAQRKNSED